MGKNHPFKKLSGNYNNYNGKALEGFGKKGLSVIDEAKNLGTNKPTHLTTGTSLKKIMGS